MTEGLDGAGGSGGSYAAAIPARIDVAVGEQLEFPLPSAAGGGFTWEVTLVAGDPDAATVKVRVDPVPRSDPPTSALAAVTLVVVGQREGSKRLDVRLARSWQPDSPLVTRAVEVVVRAGL